MVNLATLQVGGIRRASNSRTCDTALRWTMVDKRAAFLTNVEWRADNSPWTQVSIVGFVAFCSVGMFSAISNLGAGGTQDVQLSDIANSVLYGMFFLGGFFGGSINVREP
ncbi:UNC93-like protein 2 [Metarhizium anisopliae]